jgi:hypothetical protein
VPLGNTPAEFAEVIKSETPYWGHAEQKVLSLSLLPLAAEGAIQSDAPYAVDSRIEGGLAYGGGETERRGVFGNS